MRAVLKERYPSSDGEPMTDKDINRLLMEYVELALKDRYADDPMVYVSANLFIHYQDKPLKSVAPDVFMVRGVRKRRRTSYVLSKEGKVPQLAFEFMARRTRQIDAFQKKDLFETLGIEEYYIFDPTGDYMQPQLRAFHLVNGKYEDQPVEDGIVHSPTLGLDLIVDGGFLWLRDPVTRHRYELPDKLHGLLRDARQQARQSSRRAVSAERRAAREAERAAHESERATQETERATQEAARATQEAARATQEAARADALAERARELEAETERLRRLLGG